MSTSELHEETLRIFIKEMSRKGYRVIDLERKCPDAIAVKGEEIIAMEVLGMQHTQKKGWTQKWTHTSKRKTYHMFDSVCIKTFKYPIKRPPLTDRRP